MREFTKRQTKAKAHRIFKFWPVEKIVLLFPDILMYYLGVGKWKAGAIIWAANMKTTSFFPHAGNFHFFGFEKKPFKVWLIFLLKKKYFSFLFLFFIDWITFFLNPPPLCVIFFVFFFEVLLLAFFFLQTNRNLHHTWEIDL